MKHTICHFEFPASDLKKEQEFLSKLFDWNIGGMPGNPNYMLIQTGENLGGGIMKRQMKEQHPVFYVAVESVDDYCKKAEGLGGKVVVQRQPVPGFGAFAIIADPEGNAFGIFEPDASQMPR